MSRYTDSPQGITLADLKFLNSVPPQTKICFRSKAILPWDTLTNRILGWVARRIWYHEDYEFAIKKIDSIISNAIKEMNESKNDLDYRRELCMELERTGGALTNLTNTYQDNDFTSQMDTLQFQIKLNVRNFRKSNFMEPQSENRPIDIPTQSRSQASSYEDKTCEKEGSLRGETENLFQFGSLPR